MRTCFLFKMNPVRCVGCKMWEEWALQWPETSLFRKAVFKTCIIEKLIIIHQEPIEGMKLWILLGYPTKYCNYTSKKKLGRFPPFPLPPPPVDNFFNIHLTKNIVKILFNIKDLGFVFRMGSILVLFPFLWIINVQFTNYGFLNFWFSKLEKSAYFDPK